MSDPLTVHVYGHYDSRGGTMAVEAASRSEADAAYNEHCGWETAAAEDWLYEARLYGPVPGDWLQELTLDYEGSGEVWCGPEADGAPHDRIVPLVYVPSEAFDGPPKRQDRMWTADACMVDDWSRQRYNIELNPDGSIVGWVYEPARMVRCSVPDVPALGLTAQTLEFDTDQERRIDGVWSNPGWGDDACGFLLLRS